jgi:DNA-binding transcriptional LysR family regulator
MRSLNLDQLHALVRVVELGSFSAAARRLHLSQPAVSLQIRELESRLGVQLVERLGKRAYATSAGRELIRHAEVLRARAEEAIDAMRRFEGGRLGRVRLGTATTLVTYMLPPILRDLRAAHPDLELVIYTGTASGMVDRLLANEIDVGLVTLPVDEARLQVWPLREDPMLAVFPASVSDVPARVSPSFLAAQTLIMENVRASSRQLVQGWLHAGGVEPHPAMELDSLEAIKRVVAVGLGASVLPGEAVTGEAAIEGVQVRPLEPPLVRRLGIVRRKDREETTGMRLAREALQRLAPQRSRRKASTPAKTSSGRSSGR